MTTHAEKLGEQDRILELDHFSAYCPGRKEEAGNRFQKEVLKRALNTKKELFFFHNLSSCPFPLSQALSLTLASFPCSAPRQLHPNWAAARLFAGQRRRHGSRCTRWVIGLC